MAESIVLSQLVKKHAELVGLLEHYQANVDKTIADIRAIETSIKVFDPNYKIQTIRPKRYHSGNKYFGPREAQILALA